MSDNMKLLMEKIAADEKSGEKAKAIEEKYPVMTPEKKTAIISFAKELGIDMSEEDFNKSSNQELGDDELEQVAGGFFITLPWWK